MFRGGRLRRSVIRAYHIVRSDTLVIVLERLSRVVAAVYTVHNAVRFSDVPTST
jgi:hypothetical protein